MKATSYALFLLLQCTVVFNAAAQGAPLSPTVRGPLPVPRSGEDVYREACATCHGLDGRGSPKSVVGFDVAVPDFSNCAFATAEPDADWQAVVHEGGPIRGLDRHMPAFGDALSREDIALAVGHMRTFCTDAAWPRGDLNFPRAFFTEKAFPENETVWATAFGRRGEHSVGNELIYERRFGVRNQVEVNVPISFRQDAASEWNRGLGDVAVAFKRTLYASMRTGGIGGAGVEVVLPTGKEQSGLGNGYTVIEPFGTWGQMLPRNSFVQLHGGVELPSNRSLAATEAYLRASAGTTFAAHHGFGRAWSPQLELLWAHPQHSASECDVVPQMQVTLSKLQHVIAAGGIRIPISQRQQRPAKVLVYLIWDWFDGGFFEFWK